jgi:YHS domain-containing protein
MAIFFTDGPPMVAWRVGVFFAKVLFGSSELELAGSWISNMQSRSRRLLIMVVAAALSSHVFGRSTFSQAGTPDRVALSGHDPVSYFTPGHPEKGSSEFTYSFDDARYWFVSEEHRAMFAADPEHFAPQFAGYCTITVSRGAKYEADPEAWVIWDGKLFVFGSKDIVPDFNAHPGEIAGKAKAAWATLNSK